MKIIIGKNSFLKSDTASIFQCIKRESETLDHEISKGYKVNDFAHAFLLRQRDTVENTNNLKKVFSSQIEAFFLKTNGDNSYPRRSAVTAKFRRK